MYPLIWIAGWGLSVTQLLERSHLPSLTPLRSPTFLAPPTPSYSFAFGRFVVYSLIFRSSRNSTSQPSRPPSFHLPSPLAASAIIVNVTTTTTGLAMAAVTRKGQVVVVMGQVRRPPILQIQVLLAYQRQKSAYSFGTEHFPSFFAQLTAFHDRCGLPLRQAPHAAAFLTRPRQIP